MGPPPSLAVILYHPQAAQIRKAQESQSAFHTICSFLESHGQEGSANTLHSRLQGGSSQGHSHETFRGEQTCLLCPAHIISTYINFCWCPSVFPISNWDTLAQENSENRGKTQSGQGRKSPILLPSFTNLTSSIPEFKVKGSFHQEPSTTTFQFSEREECHFTGHLNILPSRKLFTILGNQREKPSVQIIFHKTTGLWQVWCEQTALLNVPLWCLDMLVRRRWIHSARTHRMCSQGSRATPWISNWSGFQGAFHLCQDKLVLLIPTSFKIGFSSNRQWHTETCLGQSKPIFRIQTLNWREHCTKPSQNYSVQWLKQRLISNTQAGKPLTHTVQPLSCTYRRWCQVGSGWAAGGTTRARTGVRRHWHRSS